MNQDVRDRVVLPLLLPLGILGFIAGALLLFSRILMHVHHLVALAIAIAAAAGILVGTALLTGARAQLGSSQRALIVAIAASPIVLGGLVATGAVAVDGPTGLEEAREARERYFAPPGSVRIVAEGNAFDLDYFELPETGEAVIALENRDVDLHNVAIYGWANGAPDTTQVVFQGEVFGGRASRTYRFPSPGPGSYYFHCDVHPFMQGEVVFTGEPQTGGDEGGG